MAGPRDRGDAAAAEAEEHDRRFPTKEEYLAALEKGQLMPDELEPDQEPPDEFVPFDPEY